MAVSYYNLGTLFRDLGETDKAREYFEKCLATRLKLHGEEHAGVASAIAMIGSLYRDMGKYEEALEYQQRALDLRQALHGDVHPHVALSWLRMAGVRKKQGENDLELELLERALGARDLADNRTHEDLRSARCTYAEALMTAGRGEEATQQARAAIGELDGEKDKEAQARARGILEGSGGAAPPDLEEQR